LKEGRKEGRKSKAKEANTGERNTNDKKSRNYQMNANNETHEIIINRTKRNIHHFPCNILAFCIVY
jgi:hypothetical protein